MLAQFAPFLPAPLLHQALGHVPVIAASPYDDGALSLLIPVLVRAGLREEVVAIVERVDTIEGYLALAPLVEEVERPALYATALQCARAMRGAWQRAEALAIVATALPEPECEAVFRETVAAAHATEPDSRSEALAVVAAALPRGERATLLRAALEELDTASQPMHALWRLAPLLDTDLTDVAREQSQHLPPTQRLTVTTLLLDGIPPAAYADLLNELLDAVCAGEYALHESLQRLARRLAAWEPEALYPIWTALLRRLAARPSHALLNTLRLTLPMLTALGGVVALDGLAVLLAER